MKKLLLILFFLLGLTSCQAVTGFGLSELFNVKNSVNILDDNIDKSAWIAYWDFENGLLEIEKDKDLYNNIIVFSAILDAETTRVHAPLELENIFKELESKLNEDKKLYLSFTNDIIYNDDSTKQKDTEILKIIFSDEEKISNHIEDIISVAKTYGVDGVEIDYEAIKNNKELWDGYNIFLVRLNERLKEETLDLRVVVEPYAIETNIFPEGLNYVVMCYNLHGVHSGPGPKADNSFLKNVYKLNKKLNGNVSMAYSVGGFSWDSKGNVKALTYSSAMEIAKTKEVTDGKIIRDINSKALNFQYVEDSETYQVWFADEVTLEHWISLGIINGYKAYSIWRL